jgi:hypothetical protein
MSADVIVFDAEQYDVVQAVAPDDDRTTTVTSAAIDARAYDRLTIVANVGTITDGTFKLRVSEDDASGGSYATTTDLATFTSSSDETAVMASVDLRATKRYVKVGFNVSGTPSTGGKVSATVLLHKRAV